MLRKIEYKRKRKRKRGKEKDLLQLVIAKRFVNIIFEIYMYPRVSASGIFWLV